MEKMRRGQRLRPPLRGVAEDVGPAGPHLPEVQVQEGREAHQRDELHAQGRRLVLGPLRLVEEAERQGFKGRNIISSILERIGLKAKVRLDAAELEVGLTKLGTPDPAATVQRWLKGAEPVWCFVDDVDQNFQANPAGKVRVASFFIACRDILNQVPQLRIRAADRPNVLAMRAARLLGRHVADETLRRRARRIQDLARKIGALASLVATASASVYTGLKGIIGP